MASSSSSSRHPATEVPRVGVGIFIFNGSSSSTRHEVLLGKRLGSHGSGTLALPGGHLELHESFEGCAAREALEETAIALQEDEVRFLTAVNSVHMGREEEEGEDKGASAAAAGGQGKHYVTIFTAGLAKPRQGEKSVRAINTEPEKCQGWAWVPFDWLAHTASLQSSVERMANEARLEGTSDRLPVSNAKLLKAQKLAEAMRGASTSSGLATGMDIASSPSASLPASPAIGGGGGGGGEHKGERRGADLLPSPSLSSTNLSSIGRQLSQSEAEGEEEAETRRKAEWIAADAFAGDAPLFAPLVRLFEQRQRDDLDAKLVW